MTMDQSLEVILKIMPGPSGPGAVPQTKIVPSFASPKLAGQKPLFFTTTFGCAFSTPLYARSPQKVPNA